VIIRKSKFIFSFITCFFALGFLNSCRDEPTIIINNHSVSTDTTSTSTTVVTTKPNVDESKELYNYIGEGNYISERRNYDNPEFTLKYSNLEGSNRPTISVDFADGMEMYFNATCEGEYSWCIKDNEMNEIGVMRIRFSENGSTARISIKSYDNSSEYEPYFNLLKGKIVMIDGC
jgi:hypothetical protein